VLDSDTAAEVEAHIGLCDGCNIYVQQMRATIRELGSVPVDILSPAAQAELVRAFRDRNGPLASAAVRSASSRAPVSASRPTSRACRRSPDMGSLSTRCSAASVSAVGGGCWSAAIKVPG
jgi:anti-sigma factor RsiW